MTNPFRQRYRVALLRGAMQRGIVPFLQQGWLIIADKFFRHKELVFRLAAEDVPKGDVSLPDDLCFSEVSHWEDLPQDFREVVSDPSNGFQWNGRDWFEQNRRLWIGVLDGKVAVLGWWVDAVVANIYFFPIPHNSELLIHAIVLPQFRGRNFQILLWWTLMQVRVQNGILAFYVHARDYNTPSLRTIEKLGFKYIGYRRISRLTRKRIWCPVTSG